METISFSFKKEYTPDVMVCGLGPAGISAAVAAARQGASVLAVDKCAYSGGNITARIEQPKLCNLMPRNARIFRISYYQRTTFEEITQSLEYDIFNDRFQQRKRSLSFI